MTTTEIVVRIQNQKTRSFAMSGIRSPSTPEMNWSAPIVGGIAMVVIGLVVFLTVHFTRKNDPSRSRLRKIRMAQDQARQSAETLNRVRMAASNRINDLQK